MSNVTLNGVALDLLEAQMEIVRRDASTVMADGIQRVKDIITGITEADEGHDPANDVATAVEVLDLVQRVARISGVEYNLPYSNEYGDYYNDTPLSQVLNDLAEERGISTYDSVLAELCGTLEDMEYQSRQWNSSNC